MVQSVLSIGFLNQKKLRLPEVIRHSSAERDTGNKHYGQSSNRIKNGRMVLRLSFLVVFLSLYFASLSSQTEISGVINKYVAVESIESDQSVRVSDTGHPFNPGDTVLLIQMKGLGILDNPPEEYGRQQDINNSGNYEFLLIQQVNGNIITFTRKFLKEYNAFETAQLVKVKGYESARVTNTLTADPWDGTKGGILAFIVINTLTLEANIDVTGKGFRGGTPVTLSETVCSASEPDIYGAFSFPEGSNIAGRKGESAVTYFIDQEVSTPIGINFANGRGSIATGGGGGNGFFAGGGGGANFGLGSFGGKESGDCSNDQIEAEGKGGYSLADQLIDTDGIFVDRFYMGGGGGGSTQYENRTATAGGNGGGMIIIIANHIEATNQYGIYADGQSIMEPASAGAGGGGGGGAIIASVENYSGNLKLSARGGKGGNVDHQVIAGPGGGGGGGKIIHSGNNLPGEVTVIEIMGGAGGTNIRQNDPHGSANGAPGGIINGLEIALNGLLLNGIQTSVHTICEDTAPNIIEGTQPRGGIAPYIYEWYKKTEGSQWTAIGGASDIDYQPGLLYETTSFLRVVKDQDNPQVIDSSNYLTITVQPKISGNIITAGQTICEGETPLTLSGPEPSQGGTNEFEYKWIQSPANSGIWTDANNENNKLDYNPPPLFDPTSYIRIALSGVCIDSSNISTINVHAEIENNILDPEQTICHGATAQTVSQTMPLTGGLGEGSYNYSWESSTNDDWSIIDINGNNADLVPGALTTTTRFRRTVESGACKDTSPPHTVYVLPLITNNTISASQTICYMDSPEVFNGSEPGGGDGNYRYIWESAGLALSWSEADGDNNKRNYSSHALSDSAYFRRVVFSGINDACKDTSDKVFVDFHPFSYAEIVEHFDTICAGEPSILSFNLNGEDPWNLTFSDGTSNYSIPGISTRLHTTEVSPVTADSATYTYQIISLTDKFGCSAPVENLKGISRVRVYAYPEPEPGIIAEACGKVLELSASPSFGMGHWSAKSGFAEFAPDGTRPNPVVSVSDYGTYEFTWTETNWQCSASEDISVTFYEQPAQTSAGSDQTLRFIFETRLEAELPEDIITAHGMWELLGGGGNIVSPYDPGTMVTNMEFGENIFIWTIYNGVCEPISDQVVIQIMNLNTPTGFSPNNNGYNDRFIIQGLENSSFNELTIFNRQGNVVYKTADYQNDWEGKNQYGNPLPEDTYYYILTVDNRYSYKGFLVLKR